MEMKWKIKITIKKRIDSNKMKSKRVLTYTCHRGWNRYSSQQCGISCIAIHIKHLKSDQSESGCQSQLAEGGTKLECTVAYKQHKPTVSEKGWLG
jgi:hypothetical protein